MKFVFWLIIKPISLLPLKVTYVLSDFLAWLAKYGLAYRQKVVNENLKRSFPEKSKLEKARISTRFYAHFYDLLFESIRLFSMPKEEALRRFRVTNPEFLNDLYNSGKSLILTGGHYQNWELFAVATAPQIKHTLLGIYTPLSNSFMEKQFATTRTMMGLVLVPKKQTSDYFEQYKDQPTITTFAIDQSPRKDQNAYWTSFLGQPTATHFGAEQYAKKYDYPVIFGAARKIKRGHYELTFEQISEDPNSMNEGEIIQKATKRLEEQIIEAPEFWLWTHKRWKLNE